MRNVILAVVAIAALTAAGVGGVFADFSDIEISEDNYFSTGSLDLAVSNDVGTHYNGDGNIPVFWEISDAWPCCDKSVSFDLENVGQGFQVEPYVYMHFKNFDCYWVQPKDYSAIWVDEAGDVVAEPDNPGPGEPQGTFPDFPKPLTEPEYVAELGGIAGQDADGNTVIVPGIGLCYGEDCQLPEHIGIWTMEIAGPYPDEDKPATAATVPSGDWWDLDLSDYDLNDDEVIKLNELECQEILLCQLPCNQGIWVHISLHFQDFDEEDAFAEGLISETYFDETIPAEAKWDHWPTNAMQKDGVMFDIAFELLQNKVP